MVLAAIPHPAFSETRFRERQAPKTLASHIQDFDTNASRHGLDKDWYKFNGIGFLMNAQMNLLPEKAEHKSEALETWAQQTKRDILGFCLEYLSKNLVFAYKYKVNTREDGTKELVDPLYGNRAAVEMVDVKERGGVVRETMRQTEAFFLDKATPDGALAVLPSPKGPSGLTTDDGRAIEYLTSFFFIMRKEGDEVIGSTIKTDLTNTEYRSVIKRLTGQDLPENASLQDYVRAIALINPQRRRESIQNVDDVIGVMRQAKLHSRGIDSAYEDRAWNEIYQGIAQGEELYNFNKQTHQYVDEFVEFVEEGGHSRLDLQKAVAATLLRISQVMLNSNDAQQINSKLIATDERQRAKAKGSVDRMSFGEVLSEVKKIPGCAGGGENEKITSVLSIGGERSGQTDGFGTDKFGERTFNCPDCGQMNVRPYNERISECQHCGSGKVAC